MTPKIEALAGELETLRSEIATLDALETPTDEQTARFAAALEEWDTKEAEHKALSARADKVDAIRTAALDSKRVEKGAPGVIIKRNVRDPFDSTRAVASRSMNSDDMRSRALQFVEGATKEGQFRISDSAADKMVRMLDADDDGSFAGHVLLTGSDDYHKAFRSLLKNQGEINTLDPDGQAAVRAALSLTGANGGFLIPVTLDPTINLTNTGSANPFRQISGNKTITTNFWEGVTSAGVNAGWLGEGGVVPDATPTLAQPVITPQKAAAWVFGSYEILSDSDFAQQFPALLTDAKDRLEENAFAVGAGTGGVPKGITVAATTAVTTAGIAAYAIADIYALQAAIPPRFRLGNKAKLVANVAIINKTRQFDTAGGSSYWTNLGQGQPAEVLGMPIYESTSLSGTVATGNKIAVAGDFSQYLIVDRVGMSVMYEPMVKDSATARPTGQAGWFAYWRVGADALVPSAFRTLTVQ